MSELSRYLLRPKECSLVSALVVFLYLEFCVFSVSFSFGRIPWVSLLQSCDGLHITPASKRRVWALIVLLIYSIWAAGLDRTVARYRCAFYFASTDSYSFSQLIHKFPCPLFLYGGSRRQQPYRGLVIPHGQQQLQIILLAQHQEGTKQGRRCSHFTWSFDDLWAAFPWV